MYRVADIFFEANNCGGVFLSRAEKYRAEGGEPEFTIDITDEELALASEGSRLGPEGLRYMLSGSMFYFELIKRGGMMLHSSAVAVDGRAYLFSGPSGMGKSTHTGLWLDLLPQAYILNDDKPALRLCGDGFYAYGTPWSGKHDISKNEGLPVAGIAFIERADESFIEPICAKDAAAGLLAGTVRHIRSDRMNVLLDTVEKVIKTVPIYRLGCTKDISSAQLAYSVMSRQNNN